MVRLSSRSLLWRGLLGIAIGIIAIAWPGVTVGAVVLIFAVLVFSDSLIQLFRGVDSEGGWQIVGHILLGLIDIAAGVVALVWPGITAEVLTIWIGIWAIVIGGGEFGMAFAVEGTAGNRFLLGLTGVLSVALGAVLLAIPTRAPSPWPRCSGCSASPTESPVSSCPSKCETWSPEELRRDHPNADVSRAFGARISMTGFDDQPQRRDVTGVGRGGEVVRAGDSLPVRPEMHA